MYIIKRLYLKKKTSMLPKYSTCCCCSSRTLRFGNRKKRPYRIRENTGISVKESIVNALETITDYIRAVLPDSACAKLSNLERVLHPLSVVKIQSPNEKVHSWIRDSFAIKPCYHRYSSRNSSSSSNSEPNNNKSKSMKYQRKRRKGSVKEERSQSPTETITILSSSSTTANSTRQE